MGLCHSVTHDSEPEPLGPYDTEMTLGFYENYSRYSNCPNSKVTNCLREVFGLSWDADLGRYQCATNDDAIRRASTYLRALGVSAQPDGKFPVVILHGQGNTSASKKNLGHWQMEALCEAVIVCGRVPVILDWDRRSPLPDSERIFCPGVGAQDIWGCFGSGDAATIRALIDQAEAFIGIDSGPGKIASATDTPTLICWRGHHPIQFHDPAPNTLHLIPETHRNMSPCEGNHAVAAFFEKHYRFTMYTGEHGLVQEASSWLFDTLGCSEVRSRQKPLTFVLPNGIGDVMWALLKISAVAAGRPIEIILSGDSRREVDRRAVPFLKRFPFVRNVRVSDIPIHPDKEKPTNTRGRYVYESDGQKGEYYFLIPNAVLESGRRIEEWLPEYPIDWGVIDSFDWTNTERGSDLGRAMKPFVAFYLGPEGGHTNEGHNLGWLWEPKDWVELGKGMAQFGLQIAIVGAPYDRSFWEQYCEAGFREARLPWVDLIGKLEIGETFALLREAKALISYQCGLGIVSHYLGVRVAMWWRPESQSAHPSRLVAFDERMRDCWTKPGSEENYLGLVYTRETPAQILDEINRRKWLS